MTLNLIKKVQNLALNFNLWGISVSKRPPRQSIFL